MGFLAVGAALAALAIIWPHRGLVARWRRARTRVERVLVEDALKHLCSAELDARTPTLEGLAGALEVSRNRVARLVERLETLGMVEARGGAFVLTTEGREYGLRILRTHRLWERYLADRTGVHPTVWHEEAERVEHELGPDDAEVLAQRLGHPLYDPHGDPIPSATGEVPPARGERLDRFAAGDVVVVRHVEDEPAEVFEDLTREGFVPGLQMQVLDAEPPGVTVRAAGREIALTSLQARNLTAERVAPGDRQRAAAGTLADLRPGRKARVVRISPVCQGLQRRRLMDLGIVPGTVVEAQMAAMGGDPVAYLVRGALIALRREQAELIQVDPLEEGETPEGTAGANAGGDQAAARREAS